MSKIAISILYVVNVISIVVFLILDIFEIKKMSGLNFSLLITFGIFTTMVFGELVLKNRSNDK